MLFSILIPLELAPFALLSGFLLLTSFVTGETSLLPPESTVTLSIPLSLFEFKRLAKMLSKLTLFSNIFELQKKIVYNIKVLLIKKKYSPE